MTTQPVKRWVTQSSTQSVTRLLVGSALTLQAVEKHFGPKRVLEGIHLQIPSGQFVAIVGKSGCGKSTLLRLIAGLDTPTNGEVIVDGQTVRKLNPAARIMFQDSRLLPWKRVLDNVGLGVKGNWRAQSKEVLAHVGLTDRAEQWPSVLSGGERQRAALARALLTRPPLLLLDEPLGALDALTRIEMQQLIERLWRDEQFTALLITHDVEEAVALADRVIVIQSGRVSLDVPISLERPRQRGSLEFGRLKERILDQVLGISSQLKPVEPTLASTPLTSGLPKNSGEAQHLLPVQYSP